MSLITRCPACTTMFRVVPDQLRISGGWVRCGYCNDVFDASAHMMPPDTVLQPPPARRPAATPPLARTASPTPAPQSPAAKREPAQAAPPRDESVIARRGSEYVTASSRSRTPTSPREVDVPAPAAAPSPRKIPAPVSAPEPEPRGVIDYLPTQPMTTEDAASLALQAELSAWARRTRTSSKEQAQEAPPRAVPQPLDDNRPKAAPRPARKTVPVPAPTAEPDAARAEGPRPDGRHGARLPRPAVQEREVPLAPQDDSVPDDAQVPRQARQERAAQKAEPAAPLFVEQARRRAFWSSGPVRGVLWLIALLLAGGLVLQWSLSQRDWLAAREPALTPALRKLCEVAGCRIAPYRKLDAVVIDNSAFNRVGDNVFRFSVTLRNLADMPVATPALELTLTDLQDQTLVRRVVSVAELAAPPALAARGEFSGTSVLTVTDAAARPMAIVGYRLVAFHP